MSNFERRLNSIHKRPTLDGPMPPSGGPATSLVLDDGVAALGWEAAERVSRILDVRPGTVIKMAVNGVTDGLVLEIAWGADGGAVIREV